MLKVVYLLASVCFIYGLKLMARPKTAMRGNGLGIVGMAMACLGTLALSDSPVHHAGMMLGGLAVGTVVGYVTAVRISMPSMPQLVALFNGFGGLASTLVATAEWWREPSAEAIPLFAIAVCAVVGTVTFWGSNVAFAKLQEYKAFSEPFRLPGQLALNAAAGVMIVVLCVWFAQTGAVWCLVLLLILSTALGFTLVLPIGGADMPVVIALLNSYSGVAASATGFVLQNDVLIIAGSLVGASGIILTQIMCRAMNRSLANVLFGGIETAGRSVPGAEVYTTVRSTTPEDVAYMLEGAQRVVIVPGYGMAVAQAQHAVRDLAKHLESAGATVEYAIHPVAGRMPGHMNVLLAEADVPYDQLLEMDRINPTFGSVDVAIVIGANDVVNPLAHTDPQSPIAGMPVLHVDQARTVVVIKRSLSPGFAKIPNPLFAASNTFMLFADGKQGVVDILTALRENG